jgi:hypothetical protein
MVDVHIVKSTVWPVGIFIDKQMDRWGNLVVIVISWQILCYSVWVSFGHFCFLLRLHLETLSYYHCMSLKRKLSVRSTCIVLCRNWSVATLWIHFNKWHLFWEFMGGGERKAESSPRELNIAPRYHSSYWGASLWLLVHLITAMLTC